MNRRPFDKLRANEIIDDRAIMKRPATPPLTRVLAEHDEAVAVGGVAAGEGGLGFHRHLAGSGCASELLDAVGVEDGAVAASAVVSSAGEERVRPLDTDVFGVEVVGLSPSDSVPLEALQELLREREVAVVRVEYVDVAGTQS